MVLVEAGSEIGYKETRRKSPFAREFIVARQESLESVPFEGFTSMQAVWVRRQMERVGLPLTDIVKKVSYNPNPKGRETLVGQADRASGEFKLFKALENFPEIAQVGTIVHEGMHFSDPFLSEHAHQYGEDQLEAEANQQYAREHATAVARQTVETHRFLNPYHKHLFDKMASGEITEELFAMETHAIMGELRFTNPEHLRQVEAAQRAILVKEGNGADFVQILSAEGSDQAVGIDRTLISLIKNVDNLDQLNNHVQNVRDSFSKDHTPLKEKTS